MKNSVRIAILIAVVIVGALILYGAYELSKPHALCMGPPYLYVTFHDAVPNVVKYTRNGCLLSENVLVGGPKKQQKKSHRKEYRSMAIGPYKDQKKALYIADGNTLYSTLMVYSECDAEGHRHYLDTVVNTEMNPGVSHIYGVCLDDAANVYASSQHTDNVLRFQKDTFEPMIMPSRAERSSNPYRQNFPGTFVQFGQPSIHEREQQGVRSLAAVRGSIWIANEELDSVSIADSVTGALNTMLRVPRPIGLHFDEQRGVVFVSSKQPHRRSAVVAVSADNYKVLREYRHHTLHHPAGITTSGDILYVAGQNKGYLLKFSISSGRYLGAVTKKLPPLAEQIALSDC